MAAQDFMVGNAPRPADYAGPVRDLGGQIAAIPGSYYAGKQQEAEMALRNAFPEGLPKNADGSINVQAAMDRGARFGGAQWVSPLLQMMMYTSAGADVTKALQAIDAGVNPPPSPQAPGPQAAIPGQPQAAAPPSAQPSPVANAGAPTLRATVAELAGNKPADEIIDAVSRRLGISPDVALTPEKEARVKLLTSQQLAAATTKSTSDAGPGPPFAPMIPRDGSKPKDESRPPSGPVAGPTPGGGSQAGPPAQAGAPGPVATAAPGPGGLPPGGPAAGGLPPMPAQQPPQRVAQVPPQPAGPPAPISPLVGPVPGSWKGTPLYGVVRDGVDPQVQLDRLAVGTRNAIIAESAAGKNSTAGQAAGKLATTYQQQFKSITDALVEMGKLTDQQKNALASGMKSPIEYEAAKAAIGTEEKNRELTDAEKTLRANRAPLPPVPGAEPGGPDAPRTPMEQARVQKQMEADVPVYTKLNQGIQALANTAVEGMPMIQIAKSTINSPGFYSGIGSGTNLAVKQVGAALGLAPEAALSQEAFQKAMAAFMLNQTNTLKAQATEMGGTSSRIFSQQVDSMTKASPSPANTIPGNRYLVEVYDRAVKRAVELADMANTYVGAHGALDPQFETEMRRWQLEHPMFSAAEVKDPRIVAAPTAGSAADVKALGLSKGDPFKDAHSGEIVWVK